MRWDGKAINQVNTKPTWAERMHEAMDSYVHGAPTSSFRDMVNEEAADSPFRTPEDLQWLNFEFTRKEKKDLLDGDLKMLRAFSKALIPVIGIIWVLFTELSPGGASEMGCRVCAMGSKAEETHWNWREAINFHRTSLRCRLLTKKQ